MNNALKVILIILLLVFLYLVRNIAAIVFFSIIIAAAVSPASEWFGKHKIPTVLGVLFIYLIALSVLGLAFYLVVPTMISEMGDFAGTFPAYLEQFTSSKNIQQIFPSLPQAVSEILGEAALKLKDFLGQFRQNFFQTASAIFGGVFSFILIIIISFYLSVQEKGIEKFIRLTSPLRYEKYVLDVWQRSKKKLGGWVKAQLLLGVLVGVLVFLGLTILGVKYALMLAVLAAIFEVIPIFGPVLAAIPAILIAFLQSPMLALAALILYVIVQQFENHLIYPTVMKKATGVPPLIIILAILVSGKLGGIFGILLAVPLTVILMELLTDWAKKKASA